MIILGFDISTSITGVTALEEDGTVIYHKACDMRNPRKFTNFWDKCKFMKKEMKQLKKEHGKAHVFIEQNLFMFRAGLSSAKTLSTLAKFNGILSFFAYELWGTPEYIAATTARKSCGIVIPKGENAKKMVIAHLIREKDFYVEYTPSGNPKPFYFDMADSYVIAMAGKKILEGK